MNMTMLLLVFATVGAVIDSRYQRRGGLRPTKKDRLYLGATVLLLAAFVAGLGIWVGGGAALANVILAAGSVAVIIFFLWEFDRSRVRHRFPLAPGPWPDPGNNSEAGHEHP